MGRGQAISAAGPPRDTSRADRCRPTSPEALTRELHDMLTSLVQRAPLFADLRRQGIAEDLVQDTLMAVTRQMQRGGGIDDPFAYAYICVTNLAKRTYLRNARELATSDDALERLAPAVQDVAEQVQQRMTMSDVLDMVRSVNTVIAELDPVELELVKAELARTDQKQLARTLGISRPTLYRRKGPAVSAFVTAVAKRAGTSPCAEHVGALLAAAGDSGFEGARVAIAHAETCEECRETIRHLTVARHGLAVIAPVPLVVHQVDTAGLLDRVWIAAQTTGEWVKAVVLRTGDPTPLTGSATKTAAIVAAACTGGGGVYTVVEGVPEPLKRPFAREAKDNRPARASKPPAARPTSATIRPTAQLVSQVVTTVGVVERRDARVRARAAADAAEARRRRRARALARAAAAARQRATQEFAPAPQPVAPATQEFDAPAPTSSTTITRREFGGGSSGTSTAPSPAASEFGAP